MEKWVLVGALVYVTLDNVRFLMGHTGIEDFIDIREQPNLTNHPVPLYNETRRGMTKKWSHRLGVANEYDQYETQSGHVLRKELI